MAIPLTAEWRDQLRERMTDSFSHVTPRDVLALLDALDAREAQTCDRCKAWVQGPVQAGTDLGWCKADHADDMSLANVTIWTRATFGCNQWAPKEPA